MRKNTEVTSGFEFSLVSEEIVGLSPSLDRTINFISRFVITLVLALGAIFTFNSMMDLKVNGGPILLILACSSLVCTIGYNSKFKNLYVFLSSVLAVILGVAVAFNTVKEGITAVYESSVKSIYESMYWTVPDMSIRHLSSHETQATFAMSLIAVLLTFAVGYFITAKINFIGAFLLTFPFFEIGAAYGCVSEKVPFACLLAGWGAALVLHISLRQRNVTKLQNIQNTKKQKTYTYTDSTKRFGASALVMVLSLLLVFSTVNSALVSAGFSRSSKLDAFRKDFKEVVLNAYDLITGFDHDASLKEGDLAVLADRKVKNRNYAILETDNLEDDLYFRGYVGGVYTGYSWEPIQEEEYEFIEEFREYLNKRSITLPTLVGDLIDTDINGNPLRPSEFRLYDFRRQKDYMYLSSGSVSGPGMSSEYDTYITADDTSDYLYNAYSDSSAPFLVSGTSRFQTEEFQKYWRTYVDFVNYEYLMLPQGMGEVQKLGEILQGRNVYESVDNVRNFVAENAEYSDYVAKLPDGKDFASYFLFEKGVGYSAHYATACAVILRAMGIPTRYVEGFLVTNEQVLDGENTGNARKVQLTDANSHAWIEVFIDGSGWIPVETTEGLYTQSFQEQYNDSLKGEEETEDTLNPQTPFDDPDVGEEQEEYEPATEDQEDAEESDELKYEKMSIVDKLTVLFFVILGAFILLVGVAVALRIRELSRRNKIFGSSDYKLQINEGFKLLKKILKFSSVNIKEVYSYDLLAKIISETFDEIDYSYVKEMITIYERTQFSLQVPTYQDATKFLDFVDELGDKVYQKLVVKDRLKFKFFDMI